MRGNDKLLLVLFARKIFQKVLLQLFMKGSGLLYVILVIQPLQQDGIKTLTEMVHEGIKN